MVWCGVLSGRLAGRSRSGTRSTGRALPTRMPRLSHVALAPAACTPAAPADFDGVRSWRGTISVAVDDTETAAGITTHMAGSLDATFGPLALDAAVSTPATPVWVGRNLRGRMT